MKLFSKKSAWTRSVTASVLAVFVFTETLGSGSVYAASVQLASLQTSMSAGTFSFSDRFKLLPESAAHVSSLINKNSDMGPFVVHLQDAHANPEAQRNIAAVLDFFAAQQAERKAPLFIALEGAQGELNPQYFDFFPETPEASQAVVEDLLAKGELSGAELFAWRRYSFQREGRQQNDIQIQGVETAEIYRENLQTYRELLSARDSFSVSLESIRVALQSRMGQEANPALMRFLRERDKRKNGKFGISRKNAGAGDLGVYAQELKNQGAAALKIDLENPIEQLRFPNFTRLIKLQQMDVMLKSSEVEMAWAAFLEKLSTQSEAAAVSLSLKHLGASYGLLPENFQGAENVGTESLNPRRILETLESYAETGGFRWQENGLFAESLKFMILQSEIEVQELFKEMERLEQWIFDALALTDSEKLWVQRVRDFETLEKLLYLELTREELNHLFQKRPDFQSLLALLEKDENVKMFNDLILRAMDFYRQARIRDEALVANALELVREQALQRRSEDSPRPLLILISGGFHAPGIQEIVQGRGLAFASVQPKLQEMDHGERYARVMSGANADLSAYFKKDNPFLTKQEALLFRQAIEVAIPAWESKSDGAGTIERVIKMFEDHPVLSQVIDVQRDADDTASPESILLSSRPEMESFLPPERAAINSTLVLAAANYHRFVEGRRKEGAFSYRWRMSRPISRRPSDQISEKAFGARAELRSDRKAFSDEFQFTSRPKVNSLGDSAQIEIAFKASEAVLAESEIFIHWGSYEEGPIDWTDHEILRWDIQPAGEDTYKILKTIQPGRLGNFAVTAYARNKVTGEKVWQGQGRQDDALMTIDLSRDTAVQDLQRNLKKQEAIAAIRQSLSSETPYENFILVLHDLVTKQKTRGIGKILYDATKDVARFRDQISGFYERLKEESFIWNSAYRERALPALQALETLGIGEIVFVSPEGPHAIAGGLAKVIEGLAKALSENGVSVTVITPLYEEDQGKKHSGAEALLKEGLNINGQKFPIGPEASGSVSMTFGPMYDSGTQLSGLTDDKIRVPRRAVDSRVYEADVNGVRYLFLRHPHLADKLYAKVSSSEELRRAIFLSRSALEILQNRKFEVDPQLVISNDWVTGLIPVFLHGDPRYSEDPLFENVGTAHMIHNYGRDYQGRVFTNQYGLDLWPLLGLEPNYYQDAADPSDDRFLNITAAAMRHVNRAILTVSRPYAEQMLTPAGGEALEGLLRPLQETFFGISNGIDEAEVRRVFWRKGEEARHSLGLEPLLSEYSDEGFIKNLWEYKKAALTKTQRDFGFTENENSIFLSMIGRVAEQKGIQLLTETEEGLTVLESLLLMNPNVQIFLGGPVAEGDQSAERLVALTQELQSRYPGRIHGEYTFVPNATTLQVMLGSRFFLMPSRYEPGGITQLESLAAGTTVIARNVGGIAATLINYFDDPEQGNGFLFEDFTGEALRETLGRAMAAISESPGLLEKLSLRAAQADNDWHDRIPQYDAFFKFSAGVIVPEEEGVSTGGYQYLEARGEILEDLRPRNRSELRAEGVLEPAQFALKVSRYIANLDAQRKNRDGLDDLDFLDEPLRNLFLLSTELIGIMSRDPEKAWAARRFLTDPANRDLAVRLVSWASAQMKQSSWTSSEKTLEEDLLAQGQDALWTVLVAYRDSNLFSPVRELEKLPPVIRFDAALLEYYFAEEKEFLPKPGKDEPSVTDLWFVYDPNSVLGLVGSHQEKDLPPHAKGGIRYVSPVNPEGEYLSVRLYTSLFQDQTGRNPAQQGVIVDLFDLVRAQETKNMLGTEFHGAKAEYTYLPGADDKEAFKKFAASFVDAGILEHEVPGPDIGMSGDKVQTGIEEAKKIAIRHLQRELSFLELLVSDSLPGAAELKLLGMTSEQLNEARAVFEKDFPDIRDPVLVYEKALSIIEEFSSMRFLHTRIQRLLRMYMIRDYFQGINLEDLKNVDPVSKSSDELADYFYETLAKLSKNKSDLQKHEFRRDYAPKKSERFMLVFDKVLGAVITGGRSDKGAIDHVVSAITAKGVYQAYLRTRDYLIKKGRLDQGVPVRLAFNGAGDVGGSAAMMAARGGDLVVAMQDVNGAVYNKKGFSVQLLQEFNNIPPSKRNVMEFFGRFPGSIPMSREKLFSGSDELEIDVIVTAATANTINETNVENIIRSGVKAIIEGGNNTYKNVSRRLAEADVITAWGSTANIGGVIASSHENQAKHRFSIEELTMPTLQSLPDGKVLTATLEGHLTTVTLTRVSPQAGGKKLKGVIELRDDRVIKPAKVFPDLPLNTLVDLVAVEQDGQRVWKAYVNNIEVGQVDPEGFVQRLRFRVDGETNYVEVKSGEITQAVPAFPDLYPGPVRLDYPVRNRKYETYQFVGDVIDAYQTVVLALIEPGNPDRDSIKVQRALSRALAEKKREIFNDPKYKQAREDAVRELVISGYLAAPEELLHVVSARLAREEMLSYSKSEDGVIQSVETTDPFTDERIRVSRDFEVTRLGVRAELRSDKPPLNLDRADISSHGALYANYYNEHLQPRLATALDSGRYIRLHYLPEEGGFDITSMDTEPIQPTTLRRLNEIQSDARFQKFLKDYAGYFTDAEGSLLNIYLIKSIPGSRGAKHPHLIAVTGKNFSLAHSGTKEGREQAVYLTRDAFKDLETPLLVDILINQILLAIIRHQQWHQGSPLITAPFSEQTQALLERVRAVPFVRSERDLIEKEDLRLQEEFFIQHETADLIRQQLEQMSAKKPRYAAARTLARFGAQFSEAIKEMDFNRAIYLWGMITYQFRELRQIQEEHPDTPIAAEAQDFLKMQEVYIFESLASAINTIFGKYIQEEGVANQSGVEYGLVVGEVRIVNKPEEVSEAFQKEFESRAKLREAGKTPPHLIWVLPYLPVDYGGIPGEGFVISIADNQHSIDTAKEEAVPLAVIPNAIELLRTYDGKPAMLRVDKHGDARFRRPYPDERTIAREKPSADISVPKARTDGDLSYRLSEVDENFVGFVGTKAAALGQLAREGFDVPPGFVLSFTFWKKFWDYNVENGSLEAEVSKEWKRLRIVKEGKESRIINSPAETRQILENIREFISRGLFSDELKNEVLRRLQELHAGREISEEELKTVLNHIRGVLAAKYNLSAVQARVRHGIAEEDVMPAVLIQQPRKARVAGTMFTANTVSFNRNDINLKASFGQGASVVGEKGQPAELVINKMTGNIQMISPQSLKNAKYDLKHTDFSYVRSTFNFEDLPELRTAGFYDSYPDRSDADLPGSPMTIVEVSQDERDFEIFSDVIARKLAASGEGIEKIFDYRPQDIEWALDEEGKLWIVQTRPQRTEQLPTELMLDQAIDAMTISVSPEDFKALRKAYEEGRIDELLKIINLERSNTEIRRDPRAFSMRIIAAKYLAALVRHPEATFRINREELDKGLKAVYEYLREDMNYLGEIPTAIYFLNFLNGGVFLTKEAEVRDGIKNLFEEYSRIPNLYFTHLIIFEMAKGLNTFGFYQESVQKLQKTYGTARSDIGVADRLIRILSDIPFEFSKGLLEQFSRDPKVASWLNAYALHILERKAAEEGIATDNADRAELRSDVFELSAEVSSTNDFKRQLSGLAGVDIPAFEGQETVISVSRELGGIFSVENVAEAISADAVPEDDNQSGVVWTSRTAANYWVSRQVLEAGGDFETSEVADPDLRIMLDEISSAVSEPADDTGFAGLSASVHVQVEALPKVLSEGNLEAFMPVLAMLASVNGGLHFNAASLDEEEAQAVEKQILKFALEEKGMRLKRGQFQVYGTRQTAVFASVPQSRLDPADRHALIGEEDLFANYPKRRGLNLFRLDPEALKDSGLFASTLITVIQAMALGKQPEDYFHVMDPRIFAPENFQAILQAVSNYLSAQTRIQTAA